VVSTERRAHFHGVVTLEVLGQLHWLYGDDAEPFFETTMDLLLSSSCSASTDRAPGSRVPDCSTRGFERPILTHTVVKHIRDLMHLSPPQRRLVAGAIVALGIAGAALVLSGMTTAGLALALVAAGLGAAAWAAVPPAAGTSEVDPADDTQELLARMSHELRTPLTSVIGLLDIVTTGEAPLDADEQTELLGLARSEAEHMEHLVAHLHSASRLASNALEADPQPVNVAGLISRVIDRFPSVARRTYLPSGDLHAFADPRLTTQIVTNLVQNIQRYAPEGEVAIAIERRGDDVAIIVSDDGPGIDDDVPSTGFDRSASDQGLGIGLKISRELAEAMGGRLLVESPRRRGATIALILPHTDLSPTESFEAGEPTAGPVIAHAPRARLLVDLAAALSERSLDRTMAGIHRLYVELLNAKATRLMVREGNGLRMVSGAGTMPAPIIVDPTLSHVLRTGVAVELTGIAEAGVPEWQAELEGRAALAMPVIDDSNVVGVLVVSFDHANDIPAGRAEHLAIALAQLAAFAVHRSALARDVVFERKLRSSVMESLPIAISVFAGDPPVVVDWNRREREMLGVSSDTERPSDLDRSQHKFHVRFADGTPLTVDNAPVTEAIRTGRSAGPFLLLVRRSDGTDITTRTYCAPFFDEDGIVAGAVVTSEELDVARPNVRLAGSGGT
jgi:signal transduction histidine kinase/PAS domain-containing protein